MSMNNKNEDKELLLENQIQSHKKCEYESRKGWPLSWFRCIGSVELFVVNFVMVAILQGATFTYLIGSLSTLEKRFAFESKISGFLLIADNLSLVLISPLVGYLGNKYNRPRIMAIGEIIAAISCFIFVIPYLIYGPSVPLLHSTHMTGYELCKASDAEDDCKANTVWTAVGILWFASFLNGVGLTAIYTIGIPYIDDNTSKKNTPIYLSLTAAFRLLGPALGLLLSSQTLKYYESPTMEPDITPTDPRWIGCWWLGFIVIGVTLLIFSIPLAFYPEIRDKQKTANKKTNLMTTRHQLYDAWDTMKRLFSNPIFVFHILGVAFKLIGYLGYYIFKPKYIESQFRKSASDANFWTGFIIIPTMTFGTIISGFLLSKVKPKARNIALYIFIVEIIISGGVLYAKSFQCPVPMFGQTNSFEERPVPGEVCYGDCHCSTKVFQPVCSTNGMFNYFSPCFAGCSVDDSHDKTSNKKTFSNCKCDKSEGRVTNGYCPTECNQFTPYITLFSITSILASTKKIGDTLITLRCVDPKDKSFAMGVTGAFIAIFALIPYPIIFGTITDSACKVWKYSCGGTGNCWLYDIEKLNQYLHNSSFAFMIIGAILHFFVVIYAKRIPNMFEDIDDEDIASSALNLSENENNNNFNINNNFSKES